MEGQTGSYVTTRLLVAPATSALTSLAIVKDELDITDTSKDARLTRYINEESAGIARYCNRIFGLATWQDTFRLSRGVWGEGVREANNPLTLRRFPLIGPPVLFTGSTNGTKLISAIPSTAGLTPGQPVFGGDIPAGAVVATVTPVSLLLSAVATAATSEEQLTAGMSVVQTLCGVDTTLVYGADYEVDTGSMLPGDEGTARVYRLNELGDPRSWYGQTITVTYQAGYSLPNDCNTQGVRPLPSDLESACSKLVVMRYRTRGRDPTVVERGQPGLVGSERYWVGPTPGQRGAYPSDIADTLDRYRVPVLA